MSTALGQGSGTALGQFSHCIITALGQVSQYIGAALGQVSNT
jgi:hypothetical protein